MNSTQSWKSQILETRGIWNFDNSMGLANFLKTQLTLVLESPVQSGLLPIFGKTKTKTGL